MGRTLRRVVVTCLSLALIVGLPASAWGLTDGKRAARGAAYLASQQQPDGSIPAFSPIGSTSDAVLAFVASGAGGKAMSKAIAYLRAQTVAGNVNSLGLRAKVVLALDAAGKNPSAFGGHDLVTEISSTLRTNGRFGTDPVFDDALAVLALASAGDPPAAKASTWLLEAQCPDGGWAYDEPYNAKHDDAHCRILFEPVKNRRDCFPHVQRNGIAPRRLVEDHPADGPVDLGQHVVGCQLDGHDASPSETRTAGYGPGGYGPSRRPPHAAARGTAGAAPCRSDATSRHGRLLAPGRQSGVLRRIGLCRPADSLRPHAFVLYK